MAASIIDLISVGDRTPLEGVPWVVTAVNRDRNEVTLMEPETHARLFPRPPGVESGAALRETAPPLTQAGILSGIAMEMADEQAIEGPRAATERVLLKAIAAAAVTGDGALVSTLTAALAEVRK